MLNKLLGFDVQLSSDNYILKAFFASGLLALVMMTLALGLIQLFRYGPSLQLSVILTMAAISFVLSASFFERYEVGSILWSMLVSIIATLMLTLLSGGIIYGITSHQQSWEMLLSGMAICMIVGMTLLSYLKRSLGEIEY